MNVGNPKKDNKERKHTENRILVRKNHDRKARKKARKRMTRGGSNTQIVVFVVIERNKHQQSDKQDSNDRVVFHPGTS